MNRPRILRWLRISFSTLCLLTGMLLIVVWVRSYWWTEGVAGSIQNLRLAIGSTQGRLVTMASLRQHRPLRWQTFNRPAEPIRKNRVWGLEIDSKRGGLYLSVPYWPLVLLSGLLATATPAKLPHRFSLRTMLIAVTLLSLGLGTILYLIR